MLTFVLVVIESECPIVFGQVKQFDHTVNLIYFMPGDILAGYLGPDR